MILEREVDTVEAAAMLLKSCWLFSSPLGAKMVDQISILLNLGPGSFTSQSLMPKAPTHIVSLLGFLLTGFHLFPSFQEFMPMIRVPVL